MLDEVKSVLLKVCLLGALLMICLPTHAVKRLSTTVDGKIRHRRLPPPSEDGNASPVFVYDPRRKGNLPRAMQRNGLVIPMPALDREYRDGEAIYSPMGINTPRLPGGNQGAGKRRTRTPSGQGARAANGYVVDPRDSLGNSARPDLDTKREGTLDYQATFDPSVVPFKRNRVLDRVHAQGTIHMEEDARTTVFRPIGNRVKPQHEVFWGSVLIDAGPGELIPLPSVSPESRILSYETSPEIKVNFLKDEADNFYVQPMLTGTLRDRRQFRLVFLMDAPQTYFTRTLSSDMRWADIPSSIRPKVPSNIGQDVQVFAQTLGITGRTSMHEVLVKLVRHFRAFLPGAPMRDTGEPYLDLALGKRGICRHRVYAFVVTAQGLGIPARYVFNEAHVFTEVWVPGEDPGWLRIDLGGAAERLVIHGAEDKVRHRMTGTDPFEPPKGGSSVGADTASAGAAEVVGLPPNRRFGLEQGTAQRLHQRLLPPPVSRQEPKPGMPQTRTTLDIPSTLIYRGEPIRLTGSVIDERGRKVVAGRVQLLLVFGKPNEVLGLLGVAELDTHGTFEAQVVVPRKQNPGSYQIVAEFLGNSLLAPSRSP
jgi:hypothetical protein